MEKDRNFYERRLQEELQKAGRETDQALRCLHLRWARLYEERLAKLEGRLAS